MKVLFKKQGESIWLADEDELIFCIDNIFYDKEGNKIPPKQSFYHIDCEEKDVWDSYWIGYEGLDEPLMAESIIEPEWEIDDAFGNYGFKNKAGEFVIEPQYAFAHDFTCGLACVNLNRTWYKTKEGRRFYENHYGYINKYGETVIGFQYNEAYPFNKYGVALVSDMKEGWCLIDTSGNEIPGTRFNCISNYEYTDRFLEFSYEDSDLIGIYDTKERKILIEPSVDSIIEWKEECIMVYTHNSKYGEIDFSQHYINSKGEVLYPWVFNKGFSLVERPDKNNVTAVANCKITEVSGKTSPYIVIDGKKYERKYTYGLYSSKEKFILPMEYDEIKNLCDNIWGCLKDGVITIIETEKED